MFSNNSDDSRINEMLYSVKLKVFIYVYNELVLSFMVDIRKTCNPGQNIWNKIEKFSKPGQDKKCLIPTFACFLTATGKV